ncbi:TPA: hypothetical protein ACH3X1_006769 [Trebouxia sp. C0004]
MYSMLYSKMPDVNDIVESAGHQVVGVQLVPNGVTIDTKNLTGIDVDPANQTALVQSGDSKAVAWLLQILA